LTTKHKKTTDLIWGFDVGVRSKSLGELFEKGFNCLPIVSGLDTTGHKTKRKQTERRDGGRRGAGMR
jgi:hypothetical protein